MAEDKKTKSEVFFDGDCPMCRAFVAQVSPASPSGELEFKNLRSEELPESISKAEAIERIHFVDESGEIFRGAQAVFKVLEQYWFLRPILFLFQLPGLNLLTEIGYRIVAKNRFLIFGSYQALFWSKLVIAVGFLIPLLITWKLWLSNSFRLFPTVPIHPSLPHPPFPFDLVYVALILISTLAVAFHPRARRALLIWIALLIPYIALDLGRLMPYTYQFILMAIVMSSLRWDPKQGQETEKIQAATTSIGLMLIAIWFWSGIQKINLRYFAHGMPWFTEGLTEAFAFVPPEYLAFPFLLGPLFELTFALLLIPRGTRRIALCMIILMHTFLFLILGPLFKNANPSVWSWNVVMPLLAYLHFARRAGFEPWRVFRKPNVLYSCVLIVVWIFPLGSFFALWPDYLSHSLYSWSTKEAHIEVPLSAAEKLPDMLQGIQKTLPDGRQYFTLASWSYEELESPAFPTEAVFLAAHRSLCSFSDELILVMKQKPDWNTGEQETKRLSCVENHQH